ncbi:MULTISPECIES: two-component system response regulator CreB [Erwinia]|uniref:DNA-binding response regulator n=1 Tax=Erwinia rhapontici TaxID=55212 RepID=A0ABM7N4D8_ERWRD|nr:two-component system response regulator CreB [Erwinia rhapontici]MBP2152471.1 two-component system catabolic regulation response regulator CreB [Erwinia rhapontici]MCS3609233.1 two-component system catabolic regulation response regulator CreB [Erwinia rhapontici]NKG28805.1 two-component system response regulator CreB [Erwinia rhapontici]TDS96479.1 two-component system catabolic regulation response regulator CreB [Erwinia rhapontici]UDQ79435.1 two-component system response regulator CreB [Er
MSSPTIWLVEDEAAIADTLLYMLQLEGFETRWFPRGVPLLEALPLQVPDLVILDVGLPDINGFELCRRLLALQPDLPVLFLTARSEEVDRLLGLEIGADDYVAKPFSPREVCARVRTLLRRLQKQQRIAQSPRYNVGQFTLDESAARVQWCNQSLILTRYEYLLLKTLLLSPGRVFSRQQLMNLVWKEAEESLDRTVDTHIKTLRAKLRDINPHEQVLMTHRGLGYSLVTG